MQKNKAPHTGMPVNTAFKTRASPPHRILVNEDDDDIRELNARVLALSGFPVNAAADGAYAWQVLNSDTHDLVVTDHNLPNVAGGLHAARMARPAIMGTGTFPEEELNRRPWLQPFATFGKL